jgi:hypothetical protein
VTPYDAVSGSAPGNSSQSGQGGGPLRITVYKYPPLNGSTADGAAPEGIDDWVVPWSPAHDALYPDDWFVPAPSTAAGIAQPTLKAPSEAGPSGVAAPYTNSNPAPAPFIAPSRMVDQKLA